MTRYVFSSHDGFGLGHVRRNTLIAAALLQSEPDAQITLVTGVVMKPKWLIDDRIRFVTVPPMLKDGDGAYRHHTMSFESAIAVRERVFAETIRCVEPDVVVVDRHPFGIAGELRLGLDIARQAGAYLALGLRDILDERSCVEEELAGPGWAGVADVYDRALVYGERVLCDHVSEYGLPLRPEYCGWVVDPPAVVRRDRNLLVVAAGGGGDGEEVFRLGVDVLKRLRDRRGVLIAGPYAAKLADPGLGDRVQIVRDAAGCSSWFAGAGSVVQMAGYNSTFESLAAGIRPVLVPRRSPRREQAVRATRLAAFGLADVVDPGASAEEVAWLLRRPRLVDASELDAVGIKLDGAQRAAATLAAHALPRCAGVPGDNQLAMR